MSSVAKKILAIYVLVLALGVTLSTLIYVNGHSVSAATDSLVETNLPRLNRISQLRVAIFSQKPILYEYYATTDRAVFLQNMEPSQRAIAAGLRSILGGDTAQPILSQIEVHVEQIAQLAMQLDETLSAQSVDWDRARELLVKVSKTEDRIAPLIDALVKANQQQVAASGGLSQSRTQLMIQMVIGFSAVIFFIAILIGYYVNAYISETAERRRLAMFPERNPSPVLRLAWDGTVAYANPATTELMLKLNVARAEELLPSDFAASLASLKLSGQDSMDLEYTLYGRVFECFVHALTDLQIFHIYVADITARKHAEDELVHQAYHDDLTGLPNRRMFGERLRHTMEHIGADTMFAVMLLRIDRIKRVLESQGYEASDNLLRAVALRLNALLQENGELAPGATLFRFEGVTFGLLLPSSTSAQRLELLADKFQIAMRASLHANGQENFFTLSIGASVFPADGDNAERLIRNAEAAVNRVSTLGGNAFQCYTQDMNDKAERWLTLENDLRRALEREELALHYQPQIEIAGEKMFGVEALLRWRREGKTNISPAEFIPLAEESGLIIPIGAWVLRTACMQARAWHRAGLVNLTMAVNISARQFQHPEFVRLVATILQETGLDPHCLELEITESVVMHDAEKTIATLNELRALNVQLSIDDFGTGYSSLSYLKRFPINKLKVDQSFVRNMATNANDASIAKSVILLGQSLSLSVIAEGVETAEQLMLLRQFGCNEVQGYLFSKPVPSNELEQFVRTRSDLHADAANNGGARKKAV